MTERLPDAEQALAAARAMLDAAGVQLGALCSVNGALSQPEMDGRQLALYDYAVRASELLAAECCVTDAMASAQLERPEHQLTAWLAQLYAAEVVRNIKQSLQWREREFGLNEAFVESQLGTLKVKEYLREQLAAEAYAAAAQLVISTQGAGSAELSEEHRALRETLRRFGAEHIAPVAEKIHRDDLLVPEEIVQGVAALGCFGLSIPARYGGTADDAHPDYVGMVIVSEELARASFGTTGSLMTRPELLAKALLKGGTEEQKARWLPQMASGAVQVAVAVTEPDFGSDLAHITTRATRADGGWRLRGAKLWCTFAGRADILMVLARTDPDASTAHRGLSLFIVEKPRFDGYAFEHRADGGRIGGRAIRTIGYRGLHSFEVLLEDYFVPAANLIGGESGLGRGFYLQMQGLTASRLQTAGRALGLQMAAIEAGLAYARQRQVFGKRLADFPLSGFRLARMAMLAQASRRLTFHAARELERGAGDIQAAMAKLFTARAAEWTTRHAQQLHGGIGYAEEVAIARHFVDARVLSIFEGAEEVLALRVIARALLERIPGPSVGR